MLKVLLICAGGMSSSVLAQRMEEHAASKNIDVAIKATGNATNNKYISEANIVLVGPQIRYAIDKIKMQADGIPVQVIDMKDYGLMNGEKVLDEALDILGK